MGRTGPGTEHAGDAGVDIVGGVGRKDDVRRLLASRDQFFEECVWWNAAVLDLFFRGEKRHALPIEVSVGRLQARSGFELNSIKHIGPANAAFSAGAGCFFWQRT